MTRFFIHDGQNEQGPLDIDQLKLMPLKKDTPIWYEGLKDWTTVGEVVELKSLFSNTSAPPPLQRQTESNTYIAPQPAYRPTLKNPLKQISNETFKLSLIAGIIGVVGFLSWLVYQNINQSESLNLVKEKVLLQDQQLIHQQQDQQVKEHKRIAEDQQIAAEKERVNAIITEKYMGYRNNWATFIRVRNNSYTYSELGGISNLEVIVYNSTDKIIDEVQVKVDYIKANGGTYKSESVSVTNIGPNASKSVSAPTSDRGTSVNMSLESISATSIHFCYPYGMDGNKNFDPYFCK